MSITSDPGVADHSNEQAAPEAPLTVQFYWAVPHVDPYDYHWLRYCPWLHVELWRGAALESAEVPPADAVDAGPAVALLLNDRIYEPGAFRVHPSAQLLASHGWPVPSQFGGWL